MSHLTTEQRYTISSMKQQGFNQTEIAKIINKDKSVVCRELKRNCDSRSGAYKYELAQKKCAERHKNKPKKIKLTANIKSYIENSLEQKLSPEQIAGVASKSEIECVSHERIYQYIWHNKKQGGKLYEHLRTNGKRYRKRGSAKDRRGIITGRVDISQRPKIVEQRLRFGDLEIDTIIGKNHHGAIVTVNDRTTGMLKMKKLESKDATILANETIKLLAAWQPYLKTITADNGKEFAAHKTISEQLIIDFFFAQPYHSWERGSNENLNGLIRQYIPKKTDFDNITDEYVTFVENQLNNRPRKRFKYESPNTIFNQFINTEKVAFMC
jgi:IS30 family transposase